MFAVVMFFDVFPFLMLVLAPGSRGHVFPCLKSVGFQRAMFFRVCFGIGFRRACFSMFEIGRIPVGHVFFDAF